MQRHWPGVPLQFTYGRARMLHAIVSMHYVSTTVPEGQEMRPQHPVGAQWLPDVRLHLRADDVPGPVPVGQAVLAGRSH